jgi:hypothetical protein
MAGCFSQFQISVHWRVKPIGTFTYFITRKGDPDWSETTADYFFTREEALAAGRLTLEKIVKRQQAASG